MLTIGLCRPDGSPDDPRNWSGTPAHLGAALREHGCEVAAIGPVHKPLWWTANRATAVSARLGHGRKVNWEVEGAVARRLGDGVAAATRQRKLDLLVLIGWLPLLPPVDVPTLFYGDATMAQRVDLAPYWSGLSRRTRQRVSAFEAAALQRVDHVAMPSEWARRDVIDRYALAPERVSRIPFGANVVDPRTTPRTRASRAPRVLIVGVAWHRKGGDLAAAAVGELRARGVDASLDVVGMQPPDDVAAQPWVRVHGFLDKRSATDRDRLAALYEAADVFLLPTRNDPYPIVLAEASAYALPIVASRVGGVTERIEHGRNGLLVDDTEHAGAYAAAITRLLDDPTLYASISRRAREHFESAASWGAAAQTIVEVGEKLRASAGRDLVQ